MNAAIVASTVANAMRGKKGRKYRPDDFIPKWDRKPGVRGPQNEQDHLRLVQSINRAMGGRKPQP